MRRIPTWKELNINFRKLGSIQFARGAIAQEPIVPGFDFIRRKICLVHQIVNLFFV